MKVRLLIIYSVIYGLAVLNLCIYWATNYAEHATHKGDELIMLAQFLLAITYLFFLAIQFTVKRISYWLVLAMPLITCITAFYIGLVLFFVTRLSGIPRHYILIYGLLYGIITLIATYSFWGKHFKKI